MTLEVYTSIIKRCVEYGISLISLNHYSEPSLDKLLIERINIAQKHGLHVELYTKASRLNKSILKAIAEVDNTILIVNIPDSISEHYTKITGSKDYATVYKNLLQASKFNIPISLSVNAKLGKDTVTLKRVTEAFKGITDNINLWSTDDRAGLINSLNY